MITEDYVDFETAKLLKEKGFDEPCIAVYEEEVLRINTLCDYYNSELSSYVCAPTLQMAMKWLREVHNIDVDINASVGMLGIKKYVAYISTYKPYKLTDIDKSFGLKEDDVKERCIQSKRNTRIPDKDELIPAHEYFDSYEQAVEAALKYCLEKLI